MKFEQFARVRDVKSTRYGTVMGVTYKGDDALYHVAMDSGSPCTINGKHLELADPQADRDEIPNGFSFPEMRVTAVPFSLWFVGGSGMFYALNEGPLPEMSGRDRVVGVTLLRHAADELERNAPKYRARESYTRSDDIQNICATGLAHG